MCTGTHPYIPVPNTAKFEMIFSQDDQTIVNVFHARAGSGWDATELTNMLDQLVSFFTDEMQGNYPIEYSLRLLRGTDLSSETGAVAERALFPPLFGTVEEANPLPNNVTAAVKWNTALRGRSYRGRTFIPCLMDPHVAGNRLSVAGLAYAGNYANGLYGCFTRGEIQMVVVSLCHGKQWRTTGVATAITSYSVNEVLDSQRRRLPERGR